VIDRTAVRQALRDAQAVLHTATLHKPHVATHPRQDFVATNVQGTLTLLEESVAAGVDRFVLTSTTSTFGRALTPAPGAPAVWVDERLDPLPRNVYGVTKRAAEDLCELVHRDAGLPCLVLRTSRFFPETDDRPEVAARYDDANLKVNELLNRRVDLEDVVSAHRQALHRAPDLGFGRYVVSAPSPFTREDLAELRTDAPAVLRRRVPEHEDVYARLGWRMFPSVDRVYDSSLARDQLGWVPRYDFRHCLQLLRAGRDHRSPLAAQVGAKGYHPVSTGPYTVR
jgi:UDP-glucose 4-epimerase